MNFQYGNNGRENTQKLINLHFDYAYKFSKKVKLTPSIDIFNAANTRTPTVHDDYGTTPADAVNPAFGYASQWLAGRSYRWGARSPSRPYVITTQGPRKGPFFMGMD